MKKITLIIAFLLTFVAEGYSQVSGYSFTEATETYTAVAGTTSTAVGDDGIQNAIPIGFTFKYEGASFTDFSISTNGWIKLGTAVIGTSSWTNNLSNTAVHRPLIAPFWDDNHLGTGNIQYVVTGVSPNRVLEVGWDNCNIGGSGTTSTTEFASFKVRLYETSNLINFVYGSTMGNAGALSASVGLNGTSSFLSLTPGGPTTASSATANNAISATTDLVGKKFIFTPPSCLAPAGITVSALTTVSATVSWTAVVPTPTTGYQYVVSTDVNPPAGAGTPTTAVSIPVTMLMPATQYYVYVRSNCGSGFSAWSSFSFSTPCPSVTTFTENFDALTAPAFPACWARVGTGGGGKTQTGGSLLSPINTMYIYGFAGSLGVVRMTPVSNLGAGTHRLSFKMRGNFTAGDVVELGYLTNIDDASTFVSVGSASPTTLTYLDYVITPPAGAYTNFIAFRHTGLTGSSILIDDISWEQIPACLEPSGLASSAVTATTATVSWNAIVSTPATGYQYVVATSNTAPTAAGTATTAITTPVTGLTANTTYYLFVRTICAGAATSSWSGPTAFTTACLPAAVPISELFDAFLPSSCWALGKGGDLTTGPTSFVTPASFSSGWSVDGFANVTSIGAVDVNFYQVATLNDWIITPSYTIPATGYKLNFDAAATQYNVANGAPTSPWEADDVLQVLVSTTGTSNWTAINTFNDTSQPSENGASYSYSLNAYSGQNVKIAFRALEGATHGTADIEFSIDNLAVTNVLKTESFDLTGFSAYPNPVKDILNLSYTKEISNVSIHNLLRQEVMTKAINASQSKIDMSNLTNGTYLVKVTVDGLVKTLKVVKQ